MSKEKDVIELLKAILFEVRGLAMKISLLEKDIKVLRRELKKENEGNEN